MNRNDDEPESIERRSCQEPPRRWPQVPRETGVLVTRLAGAPVAAEAASAWSLVFDGFDQVSEGIREALCTLGNGYFATRAAASWAVADGVHYPGVYLAGGYNRLQTNVAGRVVENEDLVNFPNWLPLNFHIADDGWFDARTTTILSYRQELDLQHGILLCTTRFEDQRGRRTLLQEQRLVLMADMHLGAMQLSLTAENWSGSVYDPFGDRRTRRQRRCKAVSPFQWQASGATGRRDRWQRWRLPGGAHVPVTCPCCPRSTHAILPRRTPT